MKNKKVGIAFFVLLLVVLTSNISLAKTGIVNTPAVRIREKASTDSDILTRAYENEEVEIVEEEGDWYKVTINGKTGYAKKNLIDEKNGNSNNATSNTAEQNTVNQNTTDKNTVSNYPIEEDKTTETSKEPEQPEQTPVTTDTSKNVMKEDVIARVLPNFGSNEAVLLTKGTEIEVIRALNNWSEIFVSGRKVWVLTNKLTAEAVVPNENMTNTTDSKQNTVSVENTVENNTTTTNTVSNNNVNTTNNDEVTNTVTSETTDNRNTKGIINVETANIREKADKSSKIIHRLDEGDEVTIVAEEGDWYKIKNSEVESGYVSKALVKIPKVSSRSMSEVRDETEQLVEESNKGTDVVNFAKQYLGVNYVLGGKTPESGFDCSGYTRYVFKNFGFDLGTVAAEQNSIGIEIDKDMLKEGDLILFYNDEKTKIGHTGIYIGNNEFIHAANPERGVVTDNLETNSYYSTRFVTARRIVE